MNGKANSMCYVGTVPSTRKKVNNSERKNTMTFTAILGQLPLYPTAIKERRERGGLSSALVYLVHRGREGYTFGRNSLLARSLTSFSFSARLDQAFRGLERAFQRGVGLRQSLSAILHPLLSRSHPFPEGLHFRVELLMSGYCVEVGGGVVYVRGDGRESEQTASGLSTTLTRAVRLDYYPCLARGSLTTVPLAALGWCI